MNANTFLSCSETMRQFLHEFPMSEGINMDKTLPKYFFSGEYTAFYPILSSFPHREVSFQSGEFLWNTSEPLTHTFYFVSGMAYAYVEHEDGYKKILSFHGAGTVFPGFQKTDFKIEKSIVLKALTKIHALCFDRGTFYRLCLNHTSLMKQAYEMQSVYINMLIYDAAHQKFNDTFRKLCNFLFLMSYNAISHEHIGINLTHENIADTLGVGRNHVTKCLSRLKNENIIQLRRRHIEVIDPQKLASYCSLETFNT